MPSLRRVGSPWRVVGSDALGAIEWLIWGCGVKGDWSQSQVENASKPRVQLESPLGLSVRGGIFHAKNTNTKTMAVSTAAKIAK